MLKTTLAILIGLTLSGISSTSHAGQFFLSECFVTLEFQVHSGHVKQILNRMHDAYSYQVLEVKQLDASRTEALISANSLSSISAKQKVSEDVIKEAADRASSSYNTVKKVHFRGCLFKTLR